MLACLTVQVDYYRICVLPMLKRLLPGEGLELKVKSTSVLELRALPKCML